MTEVHRTRTGKPLGDGQLDQYAREADQSYRPTPWQLLRDRAKSYATDARTFREQHPLGGEDDEYWARVYTTVAQELRSAASTIDSHAHHRQAPLVRPGDREVHRLGPDAVLVIDKSHCIVIATPERRVTVGDVSRWMGQLDAARTEVRVMESSELGTGTE